MPAVEETSLWPNSICRLIARLADSDDLSGSRILPQTTAFVPPMPCATPIAEDAGRYEGGDGSGSGTRSASMVVGLTIGLFLVLVAGGRFVVALRRPWKKSPEMAYDVETEFQEEKQIDDSDDGDDGSLSADSDGQTMVDDPRNLEFEDFGDESTLFLGF
jgi:hypothetical protein